MTDLDPRGKLPKRPPECTCDYGRRTMRGTPIRAHTIGCGWLAARMDERRRDSLSRPDVTSHGESR